MREEDWTQLIGRNVLIGLNYNDFVSILVHVAGYFR